MGMFDSIIDSTNEFLERYGFDDAKSLLRNEKGSSWQGLNNNLIAKFYPVATVYDENGNKHYYKDLTQGGVVVAPILDGAEIEYALNWQSPFENTGTDSKVPALTAMLQSGSLTSVLQPFSQSSSSYLQNFEGRTGITKLNSTQTFSGMPPIKMNVKLLFRAFKNAKKEVTIPMAQLIKWAVPTKLAKDGVAMGVITKMTDDQAHKLNDYLLPSEAPTLIAMEYKGRVYKPLVIEAITDPIDSPITSNGHYTRAEVSLTICSLTALDRQDIKNIYKV